MLTINSTIGQAQPVIWNTVIKDEANVQMQIEAQSFGEQIGVKERVKSVALQVEHDQVIFLTSQHSAQGRRTTHTNAVVSKIEMLESLVDTKRSTQAFRAIITNAVGSQDEHLQIRVRQQGRAQGRDSNVINFVVRQIEGRRPVLLLMRSALPSDTTPR
jgi:hypothetical protein